MADYPPYESLGGDATGRAIGEALFADYAAAGEPPDPGMGVWFFRCCYDALTLGTSAAIAKQQLLWRAILPTPAGGWPVAPAPTSPPITRTYSGNMCGSRVPGIEAVAGGKPTDASLVLSWFYDRYTPESRAKIRRVWASRGYTDVLLSWPDSRAAGFSPDQFVATCQELVTDGFLPCVMLLSKDHDPHHDVDGCIRNVDQVLDRLLSPRVISKVCIGWELGLDRWITPEELDQLTDRIAPRCVAAGIPPYVHFQQGYSHLDHDPGGSFAGYWRRQVGKLTGLLHQRDLKWDKPMYQARLVDILDRFSGKIAGTPTNNGFGQPFDLIALEITAWNQYIGDMSETEGDAWGQTAITTSPVNGVAVLGSGNGR